MYTPLSPQYSPTSPGYAPTPASPAYTPTSPAYGLPAQTRSGDPALSPAYEPFGRAGEPIIQDVATSPGLGAPTSPSYTPHQGPSGPGVAPDVESQAALFEPSD